MQKGEVIYCPHYTFPDGEESKKLLINLNDPLPGEPYLLVLTTSQQRLKLKSPGCFSNLGYHVIPKKTDFFSEDFTWILFWTLREFSLTEELKESWQGNFETKGLLKSETVSAITNCLKDSPYINQRQINLLR